MKNSLLFKSAVLAVFSIVPVGLFAEDFSVEAESEAFEDTSLWKLSFGIEGVYAMGKTDAYAYHSGGYGWDDGSYVYKSGRRETISLDSLGMNFRLNLQSSEAIEGTNLYPEFFALLGFMTALEASGQNIWILQGTAGGNLHYPLSESVSLFGGVRLGVSGLFLGKNKDEGRTDGNDVGVIYGLGGGVDFKLGKSGGSIRLGVDYMKASVEGEGSVSVADPKWLMFTVGYNASF